MVNKRTIISFFIKFLLNFVLFSISSFSERMAVTFVIPRKPFVLQSGQTSPLPTTENDAQTLEVEKTDATEMAGHSAFELMEQVILSSELS